MNYGEAIAGILLAAAAAVLIYDGHVAYAALAFMAGAAVILWHRRNRSQR